MTIEELKQKTVIELKALAYDELSRAELAQKNLNIINAIISEKQNESKQPE